MRVPVGFLPKIRCALDRIAASPNTRLGHRVIAHVRLAEDPDAVVEALVSGYFCELVDITDPDAIVGLLRDHDADAYPEQFVRAARSGAVEVLEVEHLAIAARTGANAVAIFVADGRREIVGAHPAEAIRELVLVGFTDEGACLIRGFLGVGLTPLFARDRVFEATQHLLGDGS
jgi:predicted DsbA family dithiol-disulfide isomerase